MLGRAAAFFFLKLQRKDVIFKISWRLFFSLSGEKVPFLEVVQSGHSPLWVWMEVAGPLWWPSPKGESGAYPFPESSMMLPPHVAHRTSCPRVDPKYTYFHVWKWTIWGDGKTFYPEPVWILGKGSARGLGFLYPLLSQEACFPQPPLGAHFRWRPLSQGAAAGSYSFRASCCAPGDPGNGHCVEVLGCGGGWALGADRGEKATAGLQGNQICEILNAVATEWCLWLSRLPRNRAFLQSSRDTKGWGEGASVGGLGRGTWAGRVEERLWLLTSASIQGLIQFWE